MDKPPAAKANCRALTLRSVAPWAALLVLAACERPLLVGSMAKGGRDGQSVPSDAGASAGTTAAGGAAGLLGMAGTGGFGGVGGAGGTRSGSSSPSCTSISTVPGVFNPCGHIYAIAYSPRGSLLAVGNENASPNFQVWRLGDGASLPVVGNQMADLTDPDSTVTAPTYAVAFSPDGLTLAIASNVQFLEDSRFTLWDITPDGKVVLDRYLATDAFTISYAMAVEFSHSGALLAVGGYSEGGNGYSNVEIWRSSDWTLLHSLSVPTSVQNLHFSPDDSQVIVAGLDGKARIWDVGSASLVSDSIEDAANMADADFSPDATQIASTWHLPLVNEGNVVRIWDAATGGLLQSLSGYSNYISHVVWIDQDRIVSNDWTGGVVLWARDSSGSFAVAQSWSTGGPSFGIAVLPDRKQIVAGGRDPASRVEGFVFLSL